jgi:alpha-N-acetylglucosamine transferase
LFVLIQTQILVNFANSSESNQWEHYSFTKFPIENVTYEFEQIWKEDPTYILIQTILNVEQIIDDDNQSITIRSKGISTIRVIL